MELRRIRIFGPTQRCLRLKILMATCLSPSQLFDNSASRINIFQLSNSLGFRLLDAYTGLVTNEKASPWLCCIHLHILKVSIQLQAELRVLSFLLKDHVYPGDLWEIVGERTIEAKQEAILLQHQSTCVHGPKGKRHVIVEHLLMEERKKRAQMEVSLYSQAIEYLQQHRMRELINLGT